jgi:hypothetical protein
LICPVKHIDVAYMEAILRRREMETKNKKAGTQTDEGKNET